MTTPPSSGEALAHHLSTLARNRRESPLKGLYKYAAIEGMVPLAGGMPHWSLFPYETLEAVVNLPDAFSTPPGKEASALDWFWNLFSSRTTRLTVPKLAAADRVDIAHSLQYTAVQGNAILIRFLNDFMRTTQRPPPRARHTLIASTGNTDAWAKCVSTFCDVGDAILVEAHTYPSAFASTAPMDIEAVGLAMDGEGIVPEYLDQVLLNWDPGAHRGRKRPHLLYTIPNGQNPTGVTITMDRKRAIYDLCVKHDVIIVEDDPYWNLQFSPPGASGESSTFAPGFLHFDSEGRVIRLDTFSKSIAPGSRLGWITGNELFVERLLRASEAQTSMQCGFASALITQLIALEWKQEGFHRWLLGCRAQYTARRDLMIALLCRYFDVRSEPVFAYSAPLLRAMPGFVGYSQRSSKSEKHDRQRLVGFTCPSGGMFIWLEIYFGSHPDFARLAALEADPVRVLTERLFVRLAEHKVLVVPGYWFDAQEDSRARSGYLRLSFSSASREEMTRGIKTLAHELTTFMRGM